MKSMVLVAALSLVSFLGTPCSWGIGNAIAEVPEIETTITICWIEAPLKKVMEDLKPVPNTTLLISPDILDKYRSTLVSIDLIDIELEQALDEILLPIGLATSVNGGIIRIIEQRGKSLVDLPVRDFGSRWAKYHELPAFSWDPNETLRERDGWLYAAGRVYRFDTPSRLTENKILHRWNSVRPMLSVKTRYINGNETDSREKTDYILVPVMERIHESRAMTDGLIPFPLPPHQ